MHVLIAEDEHFSKTMLKSQLQSLGHTVLEASSGNEAWELLEDNAVEMVITDWLMPDGDGLQLLERIRARNTSGYTYVIVLTNKSDTHDIVKGFSAGADDYLSKPYDREELRARVRAGERIIRLERMLHASNLRMKRDLDAAARIQRSLLPKEAPEHTRINFGWLYQPCDELAGDIFNVIQIDDDHVAFYLLDVVGHGVPAALLSVSLSRLISPQIESSEVGPTSACLESPAALATWLNRQFPITEANQQYFTMFYGYLKLSTHELSYVCAGHPGPLHVSVEGKADFHDRPGFPIGLVDQPEYLPSTMKLQSGDRLLIYSDGLLDLQNPDGDHFGPSRFLDAALSRTDCVQHDVNAIGEQLKKWRAGRAPDDDISVLAVSIA